MEVAVSRAFDETKEKKKRFHAHSKGIEFAWVFVCVFSPALNVPIVWMLRNGSRVDRFRLHVKSEWSTFERIFYFYFVARFTDWNCSKFYSGTHKNFRSRLRPILAQLWKSVKINSNRNVGNCFKAILAMSKIRNRFQFKWIHGAFANAFYEL